jgi:tripartite-type tricarboxylate transporter receptor subunit TctC
MRRNVRRATVLLPVIGLLAAACGGNTDSSSGNAAAGDGGSESCYEGKTATFVVPFSPGGGYDIIARGLAPFLAKELGADAVVVDNETGAGGLTAANNLYVAEPDGLRFGTFATTGIVTSALVGAEGAAYDPEEFTYVARLAEDDRVLVASPQSGIKTIQDLLGHGDYQYATSGVGSSDHIDANVVPAILGIEGVTQIVTGFQGGSETKLAVTSGVVDVGSGTLGTRINGIENGDYDGLLLMGRERSEDLPEVPALGELEVENPDLVDAYIGLQEVGRSVIAPPGMDENCLTELQDAIEATMENPKFLETVTGSVDVPLDYTPGEELRDAVVSVLDAPAELVTLLEKAYAAE